MDLISKYDLNSCYVPENPEAKPTLLLKEPGLTMLYLNMPPGKGMPVHDHAGCNVTLQGMAGEATVVVSGEPHTLRPGELVSFSGELQVQPRNDGAAPCAVLITLAERPA